MKFSKSILNPIRATRNGASAVSLSFLRRTNNGSFKDGGQASSPLFTTTTGKKRGGGAFENHEPSSPKVTCIGQVRVKSKKRAKQCRSLSKRRTCEVSFRKTEQNPRKNQRWVHLPTSVCKALRAFGAGFSCLLFPCKISSCVSNGEKEKNNNDKIKNNNANENDGCGAVLSRRREIETVVGGGDAAATEEERMRVRSSRRHTFDDIEVKNGRIEVKGPSMEVEEEEEMRTIPPKNALLLMRCRSDPMKMASLENRCNWEYEIEESVDFEGKENICVGKETEDDDEVFDQLEIAVSIKHHNEAEPKLEMYEEEFLNSGEQQQVKASDKEEKEEIECTIMFSFDQESTEDYQVEKSPASHLSLSAQSDEEATERNDVALLPLEEKEEETEESTYEEDEKENSNQFETKKEEEKRTDQLPESLLLMMCEPKLSMEVSKETWVRSTDFIRWLPDRPRKPAKAAAHCDHHQVNRRPSIDSKSKPSIPVPPAKKNDRHQIQPARSSCSLPAASMATMIERKLGAHEPFALTRCKSEPMRTEAAKLMPESCLWKNGGMKVEPHGRSALGVGGVAGVGC